MKNFLSNKFVIMFIPLILFEIIFIIIAIIKKISNKKD